MQLAASNCRVLPLNTPKPVTSLNLETVMRQIAIIVLAAFALCCSSQLGAQDPLDDLLQQATAAAEKGDHDRAIVLLSDVITKDPKRAIAWYLRGRANFCAGKVAESVTDFDKYVQLSPQAESRQWERGIAYYYAGEFAKGAKQFELYQTYHDQDVENSVWRYLCVAKSEGLEKAQANMLPIDDDRRVPMMQIYDLYRGKLKPEDVLKAAEAGNPTKEVLNTRLFYAHLYLGLWHEAAGHAADARKHIL